MLKSSSSHQDAAYQETHLDLHPMGLTLFQPEGEANCRGCVIAWKNQCKDIDGYNKTRVRVASAQAISPLSFSFSFFFTFMSLPASMELNRSSTRFAFLPGLIKYKLKEQKKVINVIKSEITTARFPESVGLTSWMCRDKQTRRKLQEKREKPDK